MRSVLYFLGMFLFLGTFGLALGQGRTYSIHIMILGVGLMLAAQVSQQQLAGIRKFAGWYIGWGWLPLAVVVLGWSAFFEANRLALLDWWTLLYLFLLLSIILATIRSILSSKRGYMRRFHNVLVLVSLALTAAFILGWFQSPTFIHMVFMGVFYGLALALTNIARYFLE